MTEKPTTRATAPARRRAATKKEGLIILLALGGLVLAGVAFSMLINFFEVDNKVDLANYPASEKASLTDKGTSFIEDKYTSDKPNSDYYKVRLTADSCQSVLQYYRTEAAKNGWTMQKQGDAEVANGQVDSYRKDSKGLFVYCMPGSEQLVQNSGGKNAIIILTSDSVLDLNPSQAAPPA
jgi:hypothetical protein